MTEDGRELVEALHRQAVQRHQQQKQKERELIEAAFRAALERQRQQQQTEHDLVKQVHGQAVADARRNAAPVEPPRGVHYTELPEAKPGQPLAEEWNTYRREVGRLLAEGQDGRHVLIKGSDILGIFDTFDAAYEAGVGRFPQGPFFVHPIRAEEPYLRIRGINLPWPSSPSL
jgi:hypothetical protein